MHKLCIFVIYHILPFYSVHILKIRCLLTFWYLQMATPSYNHHKTYRLVEQRRDKFYLLFFVYILQEVQHQHLLLKFLLLLFFLQLMDLFFEVFFSKILCVLYIFVLHHYISFWLFQILKVLHLLSLLNT